MRRLLTVAALGWLAASPARADETADQLKALLAKAAPSVVTLRVVVRYGGAGGREHRTEMQGALIDKSGLILCTEGPFGSSEGTSVTDLKVVIENEEKEYESFVVASDSKLHIAFVQMEGLEERELPAVDLSAENEATPEVGDRLVMVLRLDKGFDYAPLVAESRIGAVIQKPRKAWAPAGGVAPGLPCYTPEGRVIGVPSIVDSGVEDGRFGGRGRLFVLPTRTIRASVQQAQKKAVELIKTRADEKAKAAASGEAKPAEGEKPDPPKEDEKEDEGGKDDGGGFVLCALASAAPAAAPQDGREQLAALLAKVRPSIVSVRAVLQIKGEVGGRAFDQETQAAGHAVAVDGAGLFMASTTLLRPQVRFGGRGGRGGGMRMPLPDGLQATPISLKIVREGDEAEHDAFLVATDTELGLVFLQLSDPPATPLAAVGLDGGGDAAPQIGQRVLAVSRLGKAFDYAPFLQEGFVAGQIAKPRTAWLVAGGLNVNGVLGLPMYDADGRVLGVLTTLTAEMDDGGERQGTFLLPARAAKTAVGRAAERAQELLAERAAKAAEPKKPAGEGGEGF